MFAKMFSGRAAPPAFPQFSPLHFAHHVFGIVESRELFNRKSPKFDPCATATDFMVAIGLLHLSNPINGHNSNLFIRGWAFKHFELLETGMKWLSLT
jgi:hypothetical protein